MSLHDKSLQEMATGLRNKEFSSVELTQHFLERIAQYDIQLNSFITVTAEQALAQAKQADERIATGDNLTPLTGIPLAQKDIFCTTGVKTTCGSKMLENFIAPYDATVIERFNNAGAVMLGKLNMDEFAMGSSNENSYFGPCKNPWNTDYVPGGSSGGSSSAVAARLAPGATGTDTGGSIRQPASHCNITGLKPTYGRVSRYGIVAYASSLDQAGPMAPSAADVAAIMQVMAGMDAKDETSRHVDVPDYSANLNDSIKGLKIGVPEEFFADGLDDQVAQLIQGVIKTLQGLGATVHPIHMTTSALAVPTYYIVAPCECSSNLARFDGVRYGHRADNPADLEDMYCRNRGEGFGTEVKRRILAGTFALSSGYYDAYYQRAQKIRELIRQDYANAFESVDVILGPTAPTPPFKIGEKVDDPISMYLSDLYTISSNLAGLPAITAPAGFVNGLPVGFHMTANSFEEGKLLNIVHQYQQQTDWHTQQPAEFSA